MNNYKGEKQEITLSKIVSELTNQGYNIVKTDEIDGVRLNPSKMQMYAGEISTIEVIYDGAYYVEVKDKYYKITLENNGVRVNRTASEINVPTTSTNSLSVGTTNLVTTVVNNEYEIQVTAGELEGKETLTITYGDYTATCEIEVKLINGTLSSTLTEGVAKLTLTGGSIRSNISKVEIYNDTTLEHTINYTNPKNKIQETYETGYLEFYKENKYTAKIIDANNREITTNEIMIQNRDTIKSAIDLKNFANAVNGGDTFSGETVNIGEDIDLSSVCSSTLGSWVPIGATGTYFAGIFNGDYHTISNLYINLSNPSYSDVGLFSKITNENSVLKNTILDNVNIYASWPHISSISRLVGSLVGTTLGSVNNCAILSGTVSGYRTSNSGGNSLAVGGITGYIGLGTIDRCYNGTDVIVADTVTTNQGMLQSGGIAGIHQEGAMISNCYNSGSVETNGGAYASASGISGRLWGNASIMNSYNFGNITSRGGSTSSIVGGIVGWNSWFDNNIVGGTITNSYCTTATNYLYYNCSSQPFQGVTNANFVVSADVLKTYASKLGSAFEEDTKNINNGYPVLDWQNDL